MTFAKTFGQRHVLRFLSSHIDLSGCRITAASPAGLRVTDGVHQLCLKSVDGCIQRGDNPHSVAPEVIEVYGSTARRTAVTKRGELSRMPRRLTLQQTVELPESLLRHFLSHPLLSDVDVRRLVDTGSVDEDAYTSMLLWFLAAGGDGHRLIFGGCDEVGAYGEPGGTCADCVLNQFGSDGNNKGKACKNMRMLYLLRSGEYMPIQIALPPTSLTPYTRFVNEAFLSRRRKVCTGVVRIGLKKAVSGSHEYCVATFTKIADFAGEDLAHIRAYADGFVAQIKDINAQRAQAGAAASSIIGDGDASHLELPDNGAHFALGAVIDGEREELPA